MKNKCEGFYTLVSCRDNTDYLENLFTFKLILYILATIYIFSFFTIVHLFKLKKYQHNTGTAACNLCFNVPETYLQSSSIKQSNSPFHPCFFSTENPLKCWKMFFISSQNLFSFSRYLNFCFDFLVKQKSSLIKKIRFFKIYDVTALEISNCNTHIDQYLKK